MAFQTITKHGTDIATAVKRQFGDESGVQITDADIIRWINQGQLDIATRQKLLKVKAVSNVVKNQGDYPIPVDVLFVSQMLVNKIPVDYRNFDEATEYLLTSDPNRIATGQPSMWYEWAGQYSFWPVPDFDLVGGITLYYIARPTDLIALTDSLALPDTNYNTLLQYCMAQAHELDEDWTAANVKSQQYEANILQNGQDNNSLNQNTYARITVLPEDM